MVQVCKRFSRKSTGCLVLVAAFLITMLVGPSQLAAKTIPKTPQSAYAYDDMNKSYTIDAVGGGWVAEPFPDDNAVTQYLKQKLNITAKFTSIVDDNERDQKISMRYAAGDPPDLAMVSKMSLAYKLANQGQILADWSPYLKYLPTTMAGISKLETAQRSMNGKMIGIPYLNGNDAPVWQVWIRSDWLKKLKLKSPTTVDELFAVAKTFTTQDPDGNGKNDTYGFTGCGSGKGFGWAQSMVDMLFNVPGLTVENGQVIPHAINPRWQQALAYLKRAVDQHVIDPDWYSQDWLHSYNKFLAGNIGIMFMWMPGALTLAESAPGEGGRGAGMRANGEPWKFEDWELVKTKGYKGPGNWNVGGYCFVISAKAAADASKLKRILHYINWMTAPNEGGVELGLKCAPGGGKITTAGIGQRLDWSGIQPPVLTNYRMYGWANWQYIQPQLKLLPWYAGSDPVQQKKVLKMQDTCRKIPLNKEYGFLTNVPEDLVTIQADLQKFQDQAEIDFVLGKRSLNDWAKYVDDWLHKMKGEQLIAAYTEQLKAVGLYK